MSPSTQLSGGLLQGLSWLGHVARMSEDKVPLKVIFCQLPGPGIGGQPRGGLEECSIG